MTPREIVHELDRHIVGQQAAKRAVAVALRNRWRRMQLDPALAVEITPKNILMIGPTGVGKTEIARRLARLANAPFLKIEATKFTEVGYVGRDVESIVRDLVDVAMKMHREAEIERVRPRALDAAEERILDALLPPARQTPGAERERDVGRSWRVRVPQEERPGRRVVQADRVDAVIVPIAANRDESRHAIPDGDVGDAGRVGVPQEERRRGVVPYAGSVGPRDRSGRV